MITATLQYDRTIEWNNPDAPYARFQFPFFVRSGGEDTWTELKQRLAELAPDHIVIITDTGFEAQAKRVRHYLNEVAPSSLLSFGGGEQNKNLTTIQGLGDAAIVGGATRASLFVALGGGLVGNIAGLLSGLFCRGSRFVHIPTTLLAMSDSCLSLKQGVNSSQGKNHFGMFYAPALVWCDLSFLDTLPTQETQAALCELIKNILVITPHHLEEIRAALRPSALYPKSQIARFIDLCIDAKSSLMDNDAFEKHDAVLLEYGHSIGHALELASGGRLPHGLAIGIGMVTEGTLSHQLGLLSQADLDVHYDLLRANGAPVAIPAGPEYATERLMNYLTRDNKRGYLPPAPGKIDMVLLRALGEPARTRNTVITQVFKEAVAAAIDACRAA
jgi:3-dehydroquinate synthetase